ncbi:MAG: serine hydrolase domain-containing protein, partial [Chitinophagaceae bacterium]
MKGTTTAFLWVLLCLNAYTQDKRIDGIDTTIQRLLKQWKVAGVSVAIVEKNKIVLSKGFGFRDIAEQLPVNNETLFAIGSCTKAFTSSILGMLAFEGKLDLNKPVNLYMPELRFMQDELT